MPVKSSGHSLVNVYKHLRKTVGLIGVTLALTRLLVLATQIWIE